MDTGLTSAFAAMRRKFLCGKHLASYCNCTVRVKEVLLREIHDGDNIDHRLSSCN